MAALARRARGGRLRVWPLVAVTVVELVLAVAGAAGSDGLGLPQLVLPVIVLGLLGYGGRTYRRLVSADEAGATLVSYVGLIVIASLILGCLSATGMVAHIGGRTRGAVCSVLGETGCGTARNGGSVDPAGRHQPARASQGGQDRQVCDGWHLCLHCHGFWGCAGAVGMQIVDIPVGAFDQLNDDVNGILHLPFTDLGAAASGVWHHPGTAAMLVLSGEGNDDNNHGEYGKGTGATIVSVGGLFLAGAGILGKLGKLGRIANLGDAAPLSDLTNLTDLTSGATRAANDTERAANNGDLAGAQKAAARAADDARKARAKVRRDGCALAALGNLTGPRIPLHIGGRFAAPLNTGCGPEENNLHKIDDEARIAEAYSKTFLSIREVLKLVHEYHGVPDKEIREFAENYRVLDLPQRKAALAGLDDTDFKELYDSAFPVSYLESDILESASPYQTSILKTRNPYFPEAGGWSKLDGPLWPRDSGPRPEDVRQGAVEDCGCLASMMAVAKASPSVIKSMIKNNHNYTYTVRFPDGYRTTVTDELPKNGAHPSYNANWPAILEKAMAQRAGGYDKLRYWPGDALSELAGKPANEYHAALSGPTRMLDISDIADGLRNHDPTLVAIHNIDIPNATARGIIKNHTYVVKSANPIKKTVTLANPHGPSTPTVTLTEKELHTPGISLTRTPNPADPYRL